MSWTSSTLLSELSKSSHRLARWLCVCQPTCPLLPPTFSPAGLSPPSILLTPPPPLCPRPHWSVVPWLLPADQSAWCLLCLGEVNKLLGQSNGKQGAKRVGAWPLEWETKRKVRGRNEGGDREMKRRAGEVKRQGWRDELPPFWDQRNGTKKGGNWRSIG